MSTARPLESEPSATGIAAPFSVEYRYGDAAQLLAQDSENLLAVVEFGADVGRINEDPRQISVALEQVGDKPLLEIWRSTLPVEHGFKNGVAFARNEHILVGQLVLNENDYPSLDEAAFEAYQRILAFQRNQGYKHALRMWNFFPDINVGDADDERYRQFSLGRARTFEQFRHFERALPAASAIGSYRSGLLIHFVAARTPGVQIENPRQVSAFHYPRQYGPKSPSFSRAKLKDWADESQLYISGTASVVGHESVHLDDVEAQTEEIGRNMQALLDEAARHQPRFSKARLDELSLLRVYLRPHHGNVDTIREYIQRWSGPNVPMVFLEGDICRQDLLIEIEGYYQLPF